MGDPIQGLTATAAGKGVYNKGDGDIRLYQFPEGTTLDAIKIGIEKNDYKDQVVFANKDRSGNTRFFAIEADDIGLRGGGLFGNIKKGQTITAGDITGKVVHVNNERPELVNGSIGGGKLVGGSFLVMGLPFTAAGMTAATGPVGGAIATSIQFIQGAQLMVGGAKDIYTNAKVRLTGADTTANPVLQGLANPKAGGGVSVLASASK